MRRAHGLGVILILGLSLPTAARGWPTTQCVSGPFKVHADIAAHVLDHPRIAPYVSALGLNRDAIIAVAAKEPQCFFPKHPGWGDLANRTHLTWTLDNFTVGVILHLGGDAGVPCNHCPGCEVFVDNSTGQPGESEIEAQGELSGVPALKTLYGGTYKEQMDAFHADELALATEYKAYWASHHCPVPVLCSLGPYAVRATDNGQKLAFTALLAYFEDKMPVPPDSSVPADLTAPPVDAAVPPLDTAVPPDLAAPPVDAASPPDRAVPPDASEPPDATMRFWDLADPIDLRVPPDRARRADLTPEVDGAAPPVVEKGCGCVVAGRGEGASGGLLAALTLLAAALLSRRLPRR